MGADAELLDALPLRDGAGAGRPHREFPLDDYGTFPYGAFFPDGSRFAFVAAAPGRAARLYVQPVSGGAAAPISPEGLTTGRIYVSPDARSVAAVGPDERVHLYPTAGGTPIDLPGSERGDTPGGLRPTGRPSMSPWSGTRAASR